MDVSSIALSGMQAAQQRLGAAGDNIANAQTAGFRRQAVETATTASGGVTTSARTAEAPGDDLNADVVGLIEAKHAFTANLRVFQAGSEMLGTLLDEQG